MKIKGDTVKDNKRLLSGRLYRIDISRTIVFEEKDTDDVVHINFHINDGQYGIYGNEYKPSFVEDQGSKKADILALVIDDKHRRYSSWVFDVKKTIGGEDDEEEAHIGYITRCLQRDRIQETILRKRSYLEKEKENAKRMPKLIGMDVRRRLLREEARLKVLTAFQNDRMEIGKDMVAIEKHISEESDGRFLYYLNAACL